MKVLLFLLIIFAFAIIYVLQYFSIKMYDPYGIKFMWGKIGSGKSTYVCKVAMKVFNGKNPYFKRVYCNMRDVPNTYYFDLEHLIEINRKRSFDDFIVPFEYGSIVCFDEGALYFNNRDYQTFSKYLQFLFRECRHYGLYIIVLSQNFDTDKVIRSLASDMSILKKVFNCISIEMPIFMQPGLRETSDGLSPGDCYTASSIFQYKFTFIPYYVRMFDSYAKSTTENRGIDFTYYSPTDHKPDESILSFLIHYFKGKIFSSSAFARLRKK